MERLTVKWKDELYDTFDPIDIVDNEYSKINYEKLLTKLGKYEDAEEQGILIELPCGMGADVYFIPSKVNYDLNILTKHKENNRVYHQKVELITFYKNGWYLILDKNREYGVDKLLIDTEYKETWFLTKEEAEAKLKEMESE